MPFEPNFEEIYLTQKRESLIDRLKIVCKTDVLSDGVSRILNIWAKPVVYKTGVDNGRINYEGVTTFFVCYLDEESNVKKCECGSEIRGSIEAKNLPDGAKVTLSANVEKTDGDLSGTKLSVSANLLIKAFATENSGVKTLAENNDGLIVNSRELTYLKGLGVRETTYALEEEFEIPSTVSEVLCQRADAVITSAQCGVGCIIVDGNVYLSAIFLQSEGKKDIIRENKTFPFRMEIECEEAMPTMSALARVTEKSLKTDVSVDGENGLSRVNCLVNLLFEGEAISSETSGIATDVFSTTYEISLQKSRVNYQNMCEQRNLTERVVGRAQTDELPVGVVLLSACGERAEVVGYECNGNLLKVQGLLQMTAFLRDMDGKVFTRKLETPFALEFENPNVSACDYEILCTATCGRAKMISATEFELESQLVFTVYPWENCVADVVGSVELLGEKQKETYAISVYIPMEGEELWSLAKRLNVNPESLIETNPELQFPLTGKERIVVYRKN